MVLFAIKFLLFFSDQDMNDISARNLFLFLSMVLCAILIEVVFVHGLYPFFLAFAGFFNFSL
jgi:hypothetical protein